MSGEQTLNYQTSQGDEWVINGTLTIGDDAVVTGLPSGGGGSDPLKADLASPTFTGAPKAPLAASNDNSAQIATTAWCMAQLANAVPLMDGTAAIGTALHWAKQDHVHPVDTSRLAANATAVSAGQLSATRQIALSGGATGTIGFNGAANVTIPAVLATPTSSVRGGVLAQATGTAATVADLIVLLKAAGVLT